MLDRSPAFLMLDPHFTSSTGLLTGVRIKLEFEKTRRAHMRKTSPPTLPGRPAAIEMESMERHSLVDASAASSDSFDIFDDIDTRPNPSEVVSGGAR